ncbi:hypothetical protein ABZX92_20165 [Lentzea sp. NPDC006480]|uniref:hypothetical protein n=1 Tax=Lentzea sp. NPDC006480 TaxID=3157176 RepID=UPI0033A999E3
MTELDRARGAALVGFTATAALLVLTVAAYLNDSLESLGWQGGEYAYTFVWTAIGAILVGAVVKAASPGPWRSIGSGMLWAGTVGVVVVIVLVVGFVWALSNFGL